MVRRNFRATLRYIIENITPLSLLRTTLTATTDAFNLFFYELSKTTIEKQFKEYCSNIILKDELLAKQMWETIKLYGVVNAYSAFIYLELQNQGVDDITVEGVIAKLKQNLPVYLDSVIESSFQYLEENLNEGPEFAANKEFLHRFVIDSNVRKLMESHPIFIKSVEVSKNKGENPELINNLLISALDSSVDKFFRLIAPDLQSKDIPNYVTDDNILNNYLFIECLIKI
jgi:hypothetical protein